MKNAKSKRIIIVVMILLAAAAVLLLSGCERKQETVPAAGTETAVPAESTETTAPAEETEPGLLRAAVLYDISTMDVAETTDDYLIPMNVFDRLFETRPATGSSEVVKSLVTDYSVSEDGLT